MGGQGGKAQAEPEIWARKQKSVPTVSGSQHSERLDQKPHIDVLGSWTEGKIFLED